MSGIARNFNSNELIKESDENVSPLVDRMEDEMQHLKPIKIKFKPLQTVYLKESGRPDKMNELKNN